MPPSPQSPPVQGGEERPEPLAEIRTIAFFFLTGTVIAITDSNCLPAEDVVFRWTKCKGGAKSERSKVPGNGGHTPALPVFAAGMRQEGKRLFG